MGELRVRIEGVRVYSPNERDKSKNTRIIRGQKINAYYAAVAHCRQYLDTSKAKPKLVVPVDVHLTRLGKRELDAHDNLGAAFKHVTDGVAFALCSPDNNPLIRWFYHQAKGETGFELAIHGRRERVIDKVMSHDEGAIGFVRKEEETWCVVKLVDGVEHPLCRAPSLEKAMAFASTAGLTGLWLDCTPTQIL